MLGAILLFTAQGVPMLYHGQEFGARAPKTIDESKLPWEYLEGEAGGALYRHFASLAYLRHTVGALQANAIELLLLDRERKVLAFQRWNDAGSVVVVAVNLSPADQRVTLKFPRPGRWHEWLHDYDEHVGPDPLEVDIPDSYAKIWVWQE
jgi:1,4-alpha-glucan branching enzyme